LFKSSREGVEQKACDLMLGGYGHTPLLFLVRLWEVYVSSVPPRVRWGTPVGSLTRLALPLAWLASCCRPICLHPVTASRLRVPRGLVCGCHAAWPYTLNFSILSKYNQAYLLKKYAVLLNYCAEGILFHERRRLCSGASDCGSFGVHRI
jgi:hypothetical protein